jgi:hypothetical protein
MGMGMGGGMGLGLEIGGRDEDSFPSDHHS